MTNKEKWDIALQEYIHESDILEKARALFVYPYASVWVYKDRKETARDNYGICVDFFELANSKELLNSMFS